MLRVSADDLITTDVLQVVLQDLLRKQVDQSLDILSHFLLVVSLLEGAEVDIRESCLEKLNVEHVAAKQTETFCYKISCLKVRKTYLKNTLTSSMGSSTPKFLSTWFPNWMIV